MKIIKQSECESFLPSFIFSLLHSTYSESVLRPVLELMEQAYNYFTPHCTTPGHVTYTEECWCDLGG